MMNPPQPRTQDFDLLEEPWIPVSRASGAREWIAPWQLTHAHDDDPIVRVASPRADFNGALTEFLIGLLQTVCPPKSERVWGEWLRDPPSPDAIRERLEPWREGFLLFGDGPRFMQDLDGVDDAKRYDAAQILVEVPTGNTLKHNKDHFTKRRDHHRLSPHALAASLMVLQTYAPSGGAGHRTSLRGGGPLTTLVLGDTLWQTAWLNVLTLKELHAPYAIAVSAPTPTKALPWMVPTRTSVAKSATENTAPGDVTPIHALWGMPRRITLGEVVEEQGECAVYGCNGAVVAEYWTSPRGYNYDSSWRHPLSPYTHDLETGEYTSRHGNPGALQYRYWSSWALPLEMEGALVAMPVFLATQSDARLDELEDSGMLDPRVWVYGYDFDNAKLLSWYDGQAPVFSLNDDSHRALFDEAVRCCVALAEHIERTTRRQLLRALYGTATPKARGGLNWKVGGDANAGEFQRVRATFWTNTETRFYEVLAGLVSAIRSVDAQLLNDVKMEWASTLARASRELFEASLPRDLGHDKNVKSRALAGGELGRFVSPNGGFNRGLLGLPPLERESGT